MRMILLVVCLFPISIHSGLSPNLSFPFLIQTFDLPPHPDPQFLEPVPCLIPCLRIRLLRIRNLSPTTPSRCHSTDSIVRPIFNPLPNPTSLSPRTPSPRTPNSRSSGIGPVASAPTCPVWRGPPCTRGCKIALVIECRRLQLPRVTPGGTELGADSSGAPS
jgi:hypothetical protein